MNIALLSTGSFQEKEATAITIMDFAQELMHQKNQVTIICERRGEKNRFEEIKGIKIYKIGFRDRDKDRLAIYNRIFAHAFGLRRMQKKSQSDFEVIHSFSAAPILALRTVISKLFNKKALTVHTLKSYSRAKLGSAFYKALNFVDIVTVPSRVFADKLITRGVQKDKIRVIHSHIDTKKFVPQDRDALKRKYGYEKKNIIFYYGAMWEKKGTDDLIKAIPMVLKQNNKALFLFAPRNLPYAENYDQELSYFGNRVRILKEEVNIADYVAMADLVVLPYPELTGTEGNPSCLLETMACKTPVVTTSLPELQEIVGDCVFMASQKDINSIAQSIIKALEYYPENMIEKAYRRAQEFSVEKITQDFLQVYRSKKK